MKNYFLIIFFFCTILSLRSYSQNSSVIVKLKPGVDKSHIKDLLRPQHNITQVFHWHKNNKKLNNSRLSNIFSIECSNWAAQTKLIKQLTTSPNVIYAERKPTVELLEVTNDPLLSSQYYLDKINIFDAWDITSGDSSIVIAIVDTGTDFTHDDLTGKVAINRNDPINGIDDDLDGFIDNYYGWDLSENNNNPQADLNGHGVMVTGIAAAATNNAIGIAGAGYSTRYLPVKTMNNEGQLNTAWEGIVYAADHGADIIVCSWGGVIPTQFGKDIVDYATYDKDVLIVAAAGNSGHTDIYYPAMYPEVLSVAATNINDQKWAGSTYGYTIDICAPGESIYTTKLGNEYLSGNGTSFAAPSAAAVAALIKHQRPFLTACQIKHQIINTTYLLDTIPQNVIYAGKLGSGRLNAFAALADTMISGPQLANMEVHGIAQPSNIVFITGDIVNHLKSAAMQATISSLSAYATVLEPNLEIGILQTNEIFAIEENALKIKLHANIPHDEKVTLRFAINDGQKLRYRYFSFIANQSWVDITENNLNITVPANGRIGFNALSPIQGNGIWLNGLRNMILDAGIIHGNSTTQTLSTFYNTAPFHIIRGNEPKPHPNWTYVSEAEMTDTNKYNALNINTIQQVKIIENSSLQNTVFMHWKYINNSKNDYENFHMGIFFDWDLNNSQKNNIYFDSENKISICKSTDNSIFIGVKVFDRPFHHYAFELDENTEGINITDGFTTEERWFAMSNERLNAGGADGNDVAHIVSTNGEPFHQNDTIDFELVIATAFHEADLIKSITEAERYHSNTTNTHKPLTLNLILYPNPTSGKIYINSPTKIKTIYIRDLSGRIQFTTSPHSNKISLSPQLDNGLYIIQAEDFNKIYTFSKILIQK